MKEEKTNNEKNRDEDMALVEEIGAEKVGEGLDGDKFESGGGGESGDEVKAGGESGAEDGDGGGSESGSGDELKVDAGIEGGDESGDSGETDERADDGEAGGRSSDEGTGAVDEKIESGARVEIEEKVEPVASAKIESRSEIVSDEGKRHETREYAADAPYPAPQPASPHVMDVCSLTLGIISVISVFFWYITLPAGVLAIVFGAISARRMRSRIGKAGLILGIVGLAIFAFIYIGFILMIVMAKNY